MRPCIKLMIGIVLYLYQTKAACWDKQNMYLVHLYYGGNSGERAAERQSRQSGVGREAGRSAKIARNKEQAMSIRWLRVQSGEGVQPFRRVEQAVSGQAKFSTVS
jgi:hypothetical protein